MKRRAARRAALAGLALLISLASCDELFYAEGEIAAKEDFERIHVGDAEGDVRARFGMPACVVMPGRAGTADLEARCPETAERRILQTGSHATWPAALQLFPSRAVDGKVLVYVNGTVIAHYYVGPEGRVAHVEVVVS